ncbi:thyroid transcription factor 1-associated protein 26 isoform X1 [Anolis carolinensis]|uniref:thyroid transcription factor 1-associated protein 26 isoform X1 n=1 Tax=Anolis carolinensis TaxID=28377 RepID=UPI0002039455|nr:PREDICTED: thyroid transcription factor 1-associated protein 26 isoform X2 [Anolis carolinensis]|eukprot:XP_003221169.1 PREDICTED: thyroid transcription factor 1-associated protein 26 isoform X2 [Anolis carolinensis]
MAPVTKKSVSSGWKGNGESEKPKARLGQKRPWRRDPRQVKGSVQEGKGFAYWRKQKIRHDYKKLLKKESNVNSKKIEYTEDYPEHLKHLYLAEEEMLKKQQKPRKISEGIQEGKDSITPKFSRVGRQLKIKTANQKAKEDYEKIKAERDRKKEAARQRKEEREKAQELYKKKKMEVYKILSKRTKKGQPNLNIQMEYLLQKIQQNP